MMMRGHIADNTMVLLQATEFATRRHHGQLRTPSVPYVQHCFEVATILARFNIDNPDFDIVHGQVLQQLCATET